jgi:hypothetical protein
MEVFNEGCFTYRRTRLENSLSQPNPMSQFQCVCGKFSLFIGAFDPSKLRETCFQPDTTNFQSHSIARLAVTGQRSGIGDRATGGGFRELGKPAVLAGSLWQQFTLNHITATNFIRYGLR